MFELNERVESYMREKRNSCKVLVGLTDHLEDLVVEGSIVL
jgi:hypothetical protein